MALYCSIALALPLFPNDKQLLHYAAKTRRGLLFTLQALQALIAVARIASAFYCNRGQLAPFTLVLMPVTTCRDQGVGLAAPQVGVNVRLMVYNPEGEKGKGQEWILVNPRIISSGKGQDTMEEGCLSFQDISKDMYIKGRITVSVSVCYRMLPCTSEAYAASKCVCTKDRAVQVACLCQI